ncbi:ABC transporter substrate-binding protein [Streptomyces spinosus]|uniref:ABC transporter substrate-binding protein n=1 Tax=Streptomyces spinosus TaxID=2872623 RepID=UPI001CEDED43|nr:extracellular solute-binding protein [Streptomyces spinosus]
MLQTASRRPPLSRRSLLAALGGTAALGALAGCGVPAAYVAPGDRAVADESARDNKLTWANWPLYIDTDNDDPGHRSTGRDLIVISDWMCARYVRLGWVQEMDRARQPNVARYLDPLLRTPAFDKGRRFTVPWQSGITGIAYNRRALGREIRAVSDLWAEDLKGRVTLLSGLDESFALLMQGDGVDITRWTADDFHRACDQVERQVRRGQIRRFTGNDYTKDLVSGDVLACQAYSGDVIQLQADNPDIRFVVPEEGAELWSDSLMIPDRARHKANAERLIDYYYAPEAAARLAAWVNYVCPVPAAREVLAAAEDKDTAALAGHPLIFPDSGMRRRLAVARDITSAERPEFTRRWNGIVGF